MNFFYNFSKWIKYSFIFNLWLLSLLGHSYLFIYRLKCRLSKILSNRLSLNGRAINLRCSKSWKRHQLLESIKTKILQIGTTSSSFILTSSTPKLVLVDNVQKKYVNNLKITNKLWMKSSNLTIWIIQCIYEVYT